VFDEDKLAAAKYIEEKRTKSQVNHIQSILDRNSNPDPSKNLWEKYLYDEYYGKLGEFGLYRIFQNSKYVRKNVFDRVNPPERVVPDTKLYVDVSRKSYAADLPYRSMGYPLPDIEIKTCAEERDELSWLLTIGNNNPWLFKEGGKRDDLMAFMSISEDREFVTLKAIIQISALQDSRAIYQSPRKAEYADSKYALYWDAEDKINLTALASD
jgi:hypothetical protein